MKFDDQQQAYIDRLISARHAEISAKAKANYDSMLAEATAAALKPLKARLQEAYGKLRITELKAAASEAGAVDALQVAALLDGLIRVDDTGSLFVVDGEGERRYAKDGSPLTVKEAVADFLFLNPHLTGPRPLTGTGSHRAEGFLVGYARTIKRRDYDQMSPEMQMQRVFEGVRIVD